MISRICRKLQRGHKIAGATTLTVRSLTYNKKEL
jgi:hypothetical protein